MSTFLTAGEVATLLRKSTKWVYSNTRLIPGGFKLGGSWYWDKDILLSSLKELAARPPQTSKAGSADRHGLL